MSENTPFSDRHMISGGTGKNGTLMEVRTRDDGNRIGGALGPATPQNAPNLLIRIEQKDGKASGTCATITPEDNMSFTPTGKLLRDLSDAEIKSTGIEFDKTMKDYAAGDAKAAHSAVPKLKDLCSPKIS